MQNLSSKEIVEQPINLFLVSETSDVIEVVEKALAAISKFDTLTFTALNNGMPNLVLIVEIIKVKIEGVNENEDGTKGDIYSTRLKIELLRQKPKEIDNDESFYQAPYTKDKIEIIKNFKPDPNNMGEDDKQYFRKKKDNKNDKDDKSSKIMQRDKNIKTTYNNSNKPYNNQNNNYTNKSYNQNNYKENNYNKHNNMHNNNYNNNNYNNNNYNNTNTNKTYNNNNNSNVTSNKYNKTYFDKDYKKDKNDDEYYYGKNDYSSNSKYIVSNKIIIGKSDQNYVKSVDVSVDHNKLELEIEVEESEINNNNLVENSKDNNTDNTVNTVNTTNTVHIPEEREYSDRGSRGGKYGRARGRGH